MNTKAHLLGSTADFDTTDHPSAFDRAEPSLYSIPDARHRAGGIGNTLAYELIAQGKWAAVKLGGRTLITADSLNRFIASLPSADIRMKPRRTTNTQQIAA